MKWMARGMGFGPKARAMCDASRVAFTLCALSGLLSAPVWAQTAALLPNAKQTFVDANGKPLSGGKVYLYVPNTTVPKTSWSDQNESVPNANPVVLDSAGRAAIFGQGNYDQKVLNSSGSQQWYAFTQAYGAASPAGSTGTDTAPVGTVMPWAGFVLPTNWLLADGAALSRTTYAGLLAVLTISDSDVTCTASSTTLGGWADTSQMHVGAPVEASCIPTGTTISSIASSSSIVVSNAATVTATVTGTVFPWGNGDGVTTFNLPDMRGRVMPGADAMGGTSAGNLPSGYYGAAANAPAVPGGTAGVGLAQANLPNVTLTTTIAAGQGAHTHPPGSGAAGFILDTSGTYNLALGSEVHFKTAAQDGSTTLPQMTGTTPLGGSGTGFSVVQPSLTINYIVKVKANTTGAGGVVSWGGLFGDIAVDSTLRAYTSGGVNYAGCTTMASGQLGCGKPDGVTITVAADGTMTAITGVASSVGVGSTNITSGTSGRLLYDNAGVLGELSTTGTGSAVLATSPTLVTPTLGDATVTSVNKVVITTPASGSTLTIADGKTLTDTSAYAPNILIGILGGGFNSYAGTTCTNQAVTALSGAGVATCNSIANAYLAAETAYTLKGNFTGSAAAPQDAALSDLTQKVSPAGTDLVLIQDQAASGQLKYAQVSSIASAGSVSSIAGNTGAFTLHGPLTNETNDIVLNASITPQGRLTLASGTPVLNADVTAATSVYYTPYVGNLVPIYNGTHVIPTAFSELTIALGSNWSASTNYDVFVGSDSGTVRACTGPAWSTNTDRGAGVGTTQIGYSNGLLTNTQSITCRYNNTTTFTCAANECTYVGTFHTTSSAGQTEMTFKPAAAAGGTNNKLYVWNMYNRVPFVALSRDSTDTWTYNLAAWQAANASSANRITYVSGLDEGFIDASYLGIAQSGAGGQLSETGVGYDSTTAIAGGTPGVAKSAAATQITPTTGLYSGTPGLGLHYVQALEYGPGSGTMTWLGDGGGPTATQMGLWLHIPM